MPTSTLDSQDLAQPLAELMHLLWKSSQTLADPEERYELCAYALELLDDLGEAAYPRLRKLLQDLLLQAETHPTPKKPSKSILQPVVATRQTPKPYRQSTFLPPEQTKTTPVKTPLPQAAEDLLTDSTAQLKRPGEPGQLVKFIKDLQVIVGEGREFNDPERTAIKPRRKFLPKHTLRK